MRYIPDSDLRVIEFMEQEGQIDEEEASFMRSYLYRLAQS